MGESQSFQPTVRNRLSKAITLANFAISYGKFYDINNPYNETVSAQGTSIAGKAQFEWGHCGRENSPSGTEGTFEIHLDETNEKIATIYWDCPWGSSKNTIDKNYVKEGYFLAIEGFSLSSGPLGRGTISILED